MNSKPSKKKDPRASSNAFLQTMMSLYFTNKVEANSGKAEAESLPPMEALVLGMMCLNGTYSSRAFSNRLFSHRTFDSRECDVFSEVGILSLIGRGYLKPASKKAEQALEIEKESRVWGLGEVPLVVTAKGARRIGFLVANFTGEDVKDVIKRLQAESKEDAKAWTAN
jgi:hypothetical protein